MKKLWPLILMAGLAGCGPKPSHETVESLAANPERLKELQEQCGLNWAKLGDELCNTAAKAAFKRFMGNGVPYTPQTVHFYDDQGKPGSADERKKKP